MEALEKPRGFGMTGHEGRGKAREAVERHWRSERSVM